MQVNSDGKSESWALKVGGCQHKVLADTEAKPVLNVIICIPLDFVGIAEGLGHANLRNIEI